ncbi:hypothetical protein GCM10022221_44000 [Actinocorallia aurea]
MATTQIILGGGIDTTANQLANSVSALLRAEPDGQDEIAGLLRTGRTDLDTAVEELIRFDPPLQFDARTVLSPVRLAGADLRPGQMVITVLGAANRDPERFTDPDRLDFTRHDNPHLSFAAGPHYCLGAHLARLSIRTFFARLLGRGLRIAAAAPFERGGGYGVRGFARMPVRLERQ